MDERARPHGSLLAQIEKAVLTFRKTMSPGRVRCIHLPATSLRALYHRMVWDSMVFWVLIISPDNNEIVQFRETGPGCV